MAVRKTKRNVVKHDSKFSRTYGYKPQPLDELDHVIIRTLLEDPGLTKEKVAQRVGYSRMQIARRMQNPFFKLRLLEIQESLTEDAVALFRKQRAAAVESIIRHMRYSSEATSFQASKLLATGVPEKAAEDLELNNGTPSRILPEEAEALAQYQEEIKKRKTQNDE